MMPVFVEKYNNQSVGTLTDPSPKRKMEKNHNIIAKQSTSVLDFFSTLMVFGFFSTLTIPYNPLQSP